MAENSQSGILYLCSTPIGNLEDITLRALRVLKEVSLIAAEDTRHTRKLLSYYDIHTPITSYHEHNKYTKGPKLIEYLKEGKHIALVSDAGTPGISDPGQGLVALALKEGITTVAVPGASAVLTALVVSGMPTDRYIFEGFLPKVKKDRSRILKQLVSEERTVVFYESPHRILKTLKDILQVTGDRMAAVTRELTKVHEETVRGRLSFLVEHFHQNPPRGEFTIVIEGIKREKKDSCETDSQDIYNVVNELIVKGWDKKGAIKEAAKITGMRKREIYSAVLDAETRQQS